MRVIKFVQWQSSIAIGVIVVLGILHLILWPDRLQNWVQFATTSVLFVGPEKLAAFFGPVLKRKQEAK
jgi:hypothetical protein